MTIKCPVCGSDNLFIREWTNRFTVGVDILLNPPQERPRGKCMDCKWQGGFPLEQDIVINKGFGKYYDLEKEKEEMCRDIDLWQREGLADYSLEDYLINLGWRKE